MKEMKQKIYLIVMACSVLFMTGLVTAGNSSTSQKDIVTTASEAGFSTLVKALEATGLDKVLAGEGPFTVFAPSDAAFAKLPAGQLETLLMPENRGQLTDILSYHVLDGKMAAADVVKQNQAATVQGQPLSIRVEDGLVLLNDDAQVLKTDIKTSNGIIHVIDTVILPPNQ
ncbi:fasciclin domain-containing protein [Marinicella sp. W31]|uniref:fasciclin domain-containing protein n=1 Tax=Marinicella sp. W31 TaxID=3023713 RepID=UPI0037571345